MALIRILVVLAALQMSNGLTCFLPEITTTPRVGYGTLRTNTREDCEAACEADAVCISFAFSQSQGLCALHNARAVHSRVPMCATIASYTRWVKTTPTVVVAAPSLYAADACVKQAFPELTSTVIGQPPCPRRNPNGADGPLLVARFYRSDGSKGYSENQEVYVPPQSGTCKAALKYGRIPGVINWADVGYVCVILDDVACTSNSVPSPPAGFNCAPPPQVLDVFSCPSKLMYADKNDATPIIVGGSGWHVERKMNQYIMYETAPPYRSFGVDYACCAV